MFRSVAACGRICLASLAAVSTLTVVTSSCGSDEAAFCSSAQDLQTSVSQLELSDVTAALGAEFWGSVQTTVDDIVRSTSGDVREIAEILQKELDSLVERLESVNYDLAQIALSPSVAADLATVVAALIAFVANELQTEIDANCSL